MELIENISAVCLKKAVNLWLYETHGRTIILIFISLAEKKEEEERGRSCIDRMRENPLRNEDIMNL